MSHAMPSEKEQVLHASMVTMLSTFGTLLEAKEIVEPWWQDSSEVRPQRSQSS